MRLALLLLSAGLLSYGWASSSQPLAIAGAILYLVPALIDSVQTFRMAKLYRSGVSTDEIADGKKSSAYKIDTVLSVLILLAGLGAFAYGATEEGRDLWAYPGLIIWCGAILFYFVGGVIVSMVAGIPLRMGYGGWYVPRSRRRPRSSYYKSRRSRTKNVR